MYVTQLAWSTVQGARKACGEHNELTKEVSSLHTVLERIREEVAKPESPLSRCDDDRLTELGTHIDGCEGILKVVDTVLTKYNALEDDKRSSKKLWQKIRFGNGEMRDLGEIRQKICTHTQAIIMALNLLSLGSQGRIEIQLIQQGGDVKGIRESINWILARMATDPEASVMTSYTNDSVSFWRDMRRELVKDGYPSSVIHRYKSLIKAYVKELGDRGVLDEPLWPYSVPKSVSQPAQESPRTLPAELYWRRHDKTGGIGSDLVKVESRSDMFPKENVSIDTVQRPLSNQEAEENIVALRAKKPLRSETLRNDMDILERSLEETKHAQNEPPNLSQDRGVSSKQDSNKTQDLDVPSNGLPDSRVKLPKPSPASEIDKKDLISQVLKVQSALEGLEEYACVTEEGNTASNYRDNGSAHREEVNADGQNVEVTQMHPSHESPTSAEIRAKQMAKLDGWGRQLPASTSTASITSTTSISYSTTKPKAVRKPNMEPEPIIAKPYTVQLQKSETSKRDESDLVVFTPCCVAQCCFFTFCFASVLPCVGIVECVKCFFPDKLPRQDESGYTL